MQIAVFLLLFSVLLTGNTVKTTTTPSTNGFRLWAPLTNNSFTVIKRMLTEVPEGREAKPQDIMFRYYGMGQYKHVSPLTYRIKCATKILDSPYFNLNQQTVLYAHGYTELWQDDSIDRIVEAYRTQGRHNIILLDWSNMAYGNYISVYLDVNTVGEEVGKALLRLMDRGLRLDKLHLVGHSLGAHVLAASARYINHTANLQVPRLTALDPAGLGYENIPKRWRQQGLSSSDAKLVDVIHTDSGYHGLGEAVGTIDVWVNGGKRQPGCPFLTIPLTVEDFCSHRRACLLWAESVRGTEFFAKRCETTKYVKIQKCFFKYGRAPVGLQFSGGHTGDYYLVTSGTPPYYLKETDSDA